MKLQNSLNIKDALLKAMKDRGLKIPATALKLNIPKDRIYKWYQEGTWPKEEDAVTIWNWINGDNVARGTLDQQEDVEASGKKYLSERWEKKINGGPIMVPLVPIAAQAGYAQHCYDMAYIEKLETYPILPGVDPHGASWRYFQVQGESMETTLKDGQYILASQVIKEDWRNVETSYIYVIITNEGVIVKRLYKQKGKEYWAAVSDNADQDKYAPFKLNVSDVLELWKFRRKIDWDAPAPRKLDIKL